MSISVDPFDVFTSLLSRATFIELLCSISDATLAPTGDDDGRSQRVVGEGEHAVAAAEEVKLSILAMPFENFTDPLDIGLLPEGESLEFRSVEFGIDCLHSTDYRAANYEFGCLLTV